MTTNTSYAPGNVPVWGDPNAMFSLSSGLITLTEGYILALQQASQNLFPPQINFSAPMVANPPTPVTVPMPSLINVSFSPPALPAAFAGTLNIGSVLPGPLTAVQPTLNFPTAPTQFNGVMPTSPGINLNYSYPTVSYTAPTPPSLLSLTPVTFNPLVIPTFNASVPQLTLAAPTAYGYNEAAFYTSAELTAVQNSLTNALTSGTDTGLDAVTQKAIFDAAAEREYRANANTLLELERMESLGYAFPPGVYIDARIKMQTETANTLAGLSRDIMVKQAELHLENVVKARDSAVQLEGKLIDYYNQIAQRTFEAARYYTEAAISIYNGQVQAFAAQLRGYEVQATVYDTQIKGVMAQIEQLKAQIAFEQTQAEINTALVQQYKTQVDAAVAGLDVYKTEVEIIQIQANVEKTKIEAFGAQIQAYTGQVNAYVAQVEGYKAVIESQTAIEQVYKTQVDAYSVQVDAGVKAADALIEQYKGQIQAYEAQLDAFKSQLQAQVALAQAQEAYNTSNVEAYKGQVGAVSAYNQTLTAQWEAVVNEQEKIAEVAVKAAEANGQLYIAAKQLSIDASKTGAQVAAQLGAAALNAIHWSNSASWSTGSSEVISSSTSTSTSTNTNYNSSV